MLLGLFKTSFKTLRQCNCIIKTNFHTVVKPMRAPMLKSQLVFPKRLYFKMFRRATQEKLKIIDNIPEEFDIIYRNTFNRYLIGAQVVMTVTTVIIGIAYSLCGDFHHFDMHYETWSKATRRTDNESLVFVTSFVALLVILQVFVSRFPIRIYKMPKRPDYIFVFYGNWPFGNKRMVCKVGQVSQLPEYGVLPWKENRYIVKKPTMEQRIILMDQFFRRPADLSIMIGEQKDTGIDDGFNKK